MPTILVIGPDSEYGIRFPALTIFSAPTSTRKYIDMNQQVPYQAIKWEGDALGKLQLLDQTLLPTEEKMIEMNSLEHVYEAISMLRVRGAPAIGVTAAYGLIVAMQNHLDEGCEKYLESLNRHADYLAKSRPTAVNLFWALNRMRKKATSVGEKKTADLHQILFEEAQLIEQEDILMCQKMGEYGRSLLENCTGVLTHCNTGALATAGLGTAFSVILHAWQKYQKLTVYADETRPLLQGARLTSWEFQKFKVPVKLITDSMAAWVMKEKKVQAVVVGSDRIAANGDAANKIGTYGLSILAKHHNVPFYIAAPSSTFDLELAHGGLIPIEERRANEITHVRETQIAPDATEVYNPAFDVAPHENIAGIVTEKGVISPVNTETVRAMIS